MTATTRRNCWTCQHNVVRNGWGDCHADFATGWTTWWIAATEDNSSSDESNMPPRDADGCPGWEAVEVLP